MKDSGWINVLARDPPENLLCRFTCDLTGEQLTGYWREILPGLAAMNLDLYWWKLTGIGRAQLEGEI